MSQILLCRAQSDALSTGLEPYFLLVCILSDKKLVGTYKILDISLMMKLNL